MSNLYPERDYSCGAQFCDDPACNTHGPKDADNNLLYWGCGICGGTGAVDSGGFTPWGEGIDVGCGHCNGTGKGPEV